MRLSEIYKQVVAIGWDSRNVDASDFRFLRALSLPVLPSGEIPTLEEKSIGVALRETGTGRIVAIALESRYKTQPMSNAMQALGRLRAGAKTLDVINNGAGTTMLLKPPKPKKIIALAPRYVLKLEAIGDNEQAYLRDFDKNIWTSKVAYKHTSWRLLKAFKLGYTKPWVARITGLDPRYRLAREFLRAEKDYTEADGTGSRGIMLYYWLEPGIYEINQRLSWKNHRRHFAHVIDHETLIELTKEEVLQWLQQNASDI